MFCLAGGRATVNQEKEVARDGSLALWLSAYVHESASRPGLDLGTGWSQPVCLTLENGRLEHPFAASSLWITDGYLTVSDRVFDNVLPLPFDERGQIYLFLSGPEGELVIVGQRALLELTGEALYVEDFPGKNATL